MVPFIQKAHGCIFLYNAIKAQAAQLAISDSPPTALLPSRTTATIRAAATSADAADTAAPPTCYRRRCGVALPPLPQPSSCCHRAATVALFAAAALCAPNTAAPPTCYRQRRGVALPPPPQPPRRGNRGGSATPAARQQGGDGRDSVAAGATALAQRQRQRSGGGSAAAGSAAAALWRQRGCGGQLGRLAMAAAARRPRRQCR
jgi:hypothetical protein